MAGWISDSERLGLGEAHRQDCALRRKLVSQNGDFSGSSEGGEKGGTTLSA